MSPVLGDRVQVFSINVVILLTKYEFKECDIIYEFLYKEELIKFKISDIC